MSSLKLERNPVFHARSKHIELQHHFIRERTLTQELTVSYLKTEDQTADVFTKAIPMATFEKHRKALGVGPIQQ